jgi:hypothetical protein
VARDDHHVFVVIDDVEHGPYDAVPSELVLFSPDGARIAYAAQTDDDWIVVVAGTDDPRANQAKHGGAFSAVYPGDFVFSRDGRRFAFAAQRDAHRVVVVDGAEWGSYPWAGRLLFSPNGKKLMYQARQNGNRAPNLGRHESIADLTFSPDGGRMAYWTRHNNTWKVATADAGGKTLDVSEAFDSFVRGSLKFSPNGARLAFVGARDGQAVVVVDGVESQPYEAALVGSPIFSPDSQRVGCGVYQGGMWRILVDQQEGSYECGLIKEHTLQFTPDSQRLAWVASYAASGHAMAIVVDGEFSDDYLFPLESPLAFDGPRSFHTIAVTGTIVPAENGMTPQIDDGEFLRLSVEIGPRQ